MQLARWLSSSVVSVHVVGAESAEGTHAPAGPAVATIVVMGESAAPPAHAALGPHAAAALSHLRGMAGALFGGQDQHRRSAAAEQQAIGHVGQLEPGVASG